MALLKSEYTSKKSIKVNSINFKEYVLTVKINSYKDGSLEYTINDSDGYLNLDLEVDTLSENKLKRNVLSHIVTVLKSNHTVVDKETYAALHKDLMSLSYKAKDMLGKSTVDYNVTECQAVLYITNFDKE